jgi:Holliday junction resolvase-like predicted endonuclease
MLLLWLKLLGFDLIAELPTNIGRIDAVWAFPGHTIIVEVKSQPKKTNISKLLDTAIKQIRETRYYERFSSESQVSLLGVAFAGNEIGCRIETL